VEERRAPDPHRPGEIPDGRRYAKAGRPGTAVLVVSVVVLLAVAFVVYGLLR
jgi:hypothetical protein